MGLVAEAGSARGGQEAGLCGGGTKGSLRGPGFVEMGPCEEVKGAGPGEALLEPDQR